MPIDLGTLIFIFFLLFTLVPAINRWRIDMQRQLLIRRIERKRGSRLITLIHRQEAVSFLGIAFSRYIDIEDSEEVLRAIRFTPPDLPIDILLHTPGGLVLAAEQIAQALVRHSAKVTVFVPHYAMSGGTFVALAADEIVMDENAVLGPVDPQIGVHPAASILSVLERKPISQIDDDTLIRADMARKAQRQVISSVIELLQANGMPAAKAEEVATYISSGQWTHDYPISPSEAKGFGLPVSTTGLPPEVYDLMDLFPQAASRRPSVQYIPMPYGPAGRRGRQD